MNESCKAQKRIKLHNRQECKTQISLIMFLHQRDRILTRKQVLDILKARKGLKDHQKIDIDNIVDYVEQQSSQIKIEEKYGDSRDETQFSLEILKKKQLSGRLKTQNKKFNFESKKQILQENQANQKEKKQQSEKKLKAKVKAKEHKKFIFPNEKHNNLK